MLLLILAVGLFIFAWSRHRASVQRMRNIERQMDQVYGVNYPRTVPRPMGIPNPPVYTPPAQTSTHTYAEDVAVAAGVGLAGAAVYELLSHERDEDSSSSNNDDDNDDSSDDDSDDGFSGGDSGGGGSDGDF